jgi:hypothetical protein
MFVAKCLYLQLMNMKAYNISKSAKCEFGKYVHSKVEQPASPLMCFPAPQIAARHLAAVTFLHVVGLNCTGGNPTGNATASSVS